MASKELSEMDKAFWMKIATSGMNEEAMRKMVAGSLTFFAGVGTYKGYLAQWSEVSAKATWKELGNISQNSGDVFPRIAAEIIVEKAMADVKEAQRLLVASGSPSQGVSWKRKRKSILKRLKTQTYQIGLERIKNI